MTDDNFIHRTRGKHIWQVQSKKKKVNYIQEEGIYSLVSAPVMMRTAHYNLNLYRDNWKHKICKSELIHLSFVFGPQKSRIDFYLRSKTMPNRRMHSRQDIILTARGSLTLSFVRSIIKRLFQYYEYTCKIHICYWVYWLYIYIDYHLVYLFLLFIHKMHKRLKSRS